MNLNPVETEEIFELRFKSADNRTKKITIKKPALNILAQDVQTALDIIASTEIFAKAGIDSYAQPVDGRYIERTVRNVYVAPEV